MYSISPRLTDNYSTNTSLNDLIDAIDNRIVEISIVEYNNVRFGFKQFVNMEQYEDLIIYRKMLLDKLLGCNCLEDVYLIKIVSKLKKLIQ